VGGVGPGRDAATQKVRLTRRQNLMPRFEVCVGPHYCVAECKAAHTPFAREELQLRKRKAQTQPPNRTGRPHDQSFHPSAHHDHSLCHRCRRTKRASGKPVRRRLGRPSFHENWRMRAELPVKRADRQWGREFPGHCFARRAERRGDRHDHGGPEPRRRDGAAVGSFRWWNMAGPGAGWDLYGHLESGAKVNSVRRYYWF
jgi:hypothetical protein